MVIFSCLTQELSLLQTSKVLNDVFLYLAEVKKQLLSDVFYWNFYKTYGISTFKITRQNLGPRDERFNSQWL